jgi:hypothetical protein
MQYSVLYMPMKGKTLIIVWNIVESGAKHHNPNT